MGKTNGVFYQTHYNKNGNEYYPEKNKQKSLTVPGRSLSPDEVLKRFASGRSINVPPSYFEGPEDWDGKNRMPDLEQMDLIDIERLQAENQVRIETLQARAKQDHQEAQKRYIERMNANKKRQEEIDAFLASKAAKEKLPGTNGLD